MESLASELFEYSELYTSIQGEGMHTGLPCFFIRSSVCDIRCSWCDTPQALGRGRYISFLDLLKQLPSHIHLVQITGGEPLVQTNQVVSLIKILQAPPYAKKILLETGGHRSLARVPVATHIVMDIKLPSSGESHHAFENNLVYLKRSDEIKFVIQDRNDFLKACEWIEKYDLTKCCNILFSPVDSTLSLKDLVAWTLAEKLAVRVQVQLHKVIWGADAVAR